MIRQLQQAGIKCTVLERAAESRLEADVGSGYDLSPSSAEVLRRVGLGDTLGARGIFRGNEAMWISSADGEVLRLASLTGEQHAGYYVASRSKLQRALLGALRDGGLASTASELDADIGTRLMCGYDVLSFDEDEEGEMELTEDAEAKIDEMLAGRSLARHTPAWLEAPARARSMVCASSTRNRGTSGRKCRPSCTPVHAQVAFDVQLSCSSQPLPASSRSTVCSARVPSSVITSERRRSHAAATTSPPDDAFGVSTSPQVHACLPCAVAFT